MCIRDRFVGFGPYEDPEIALAEMCIRDSPGTMESYLEAKARIA